MSQHLLDNRRHLIVTASNAWSAVYERQKLWRQMTLREAPFEGNEMTEWGIDHEHLALCEFEKAMDQICEVGNKLIVHPDLPLGASPDGFLDRLPIEIKCPFTQEFYGMIPDRYYFQTQLQMEVCNAPRCYFVVWTPKGITIQIIERSKEWFDWYKPLVLEFMKFVEDDIEPTRWKRKPIFDIDLKEDKLLFPKEQLNG
jgi:putative phage-type endonuclease